PHAPRDGPRAPAPRHARDGSARLSGDARADRRRTPGPRAAHHQPHPARAGTGSARGDGRHMAARRDDHRTAALKLGERTRHRRSEMKATVVTDRAAGTAGMTLVERPEPPAAINDVIVEVHASGFVPTEMEWPSTWTDRSGRDRTPSIPGHELAGVVTALGYGTTGLSIGQRVFGLTDWYRDGTLAEYVAVEARNLTPVPADADVPVGAAVVMP